nr:hypothetical protein BCU52_02775 [Vibrio cyclitrophicus]
MSKLKPAKRSLGIADRFKKANCEELYSTVYNQLCRYTHGNITALASKHFENDSIVLASSISDAELSFIISSTINTAIISTHDLLEFYEVDDAYLKDCLGLSAQVKAVSEKFV